jgi:hypothetical protein
MIMTDTDIDKRNESRRQSLAKARQVLANERAAERERIFAKRDTPPAPAQTSEFEGLSITECCDECVRNLAKARAAQKRINEIEATYKRAPSRIDGNESVMEGDVEWMARIGKTNPDVPIEWAKVSQAAGGHCIISGKSYCGSPSKGGLHSAEKNDYEALKRFKRAKAVLLDAKIDLQRMSEL